MEARFSDPAALERRHLLFGPRCKRSRREAGGQSQASKSGEAAAGQANTDTKLNLQMPTATRKQRVHLRGALVALAALASLVPLHAAELHSQSEPLASNEISQQLASNYSHLTRGEYRPERMSRWMIALGATNTTNEPARHDNRCDKSAHHAGSALDPVALELCAARCRQQPRPTGGIRNQVSYRRLNRGHLSLGG